MSKRKHNSDKNEFALQEENELLKKTLNAINSGIVIADKNGNVLYVNDAANHPVSKKLRKHQASAWPDIFNLKRLDNTPVSYEEMPMIRTLKTGKPHSEDLIVLNHKKEKIILNVNAKPIFDNKKKLSGVMVAYHDITELKQREAELKNALQDKQLLFTAIETTSDIVAVTDFYGRLMYFNKAARNALNPRNVKDISKIKVKDYHSPESWQKLRHEMIPQAIKNGSATGELTFIKKSGEEVYVSQVLVCKKDAKGKVEFFASISRDISALIAKEELVKKQQAYIQNILDANPSPIFVKDIDGTYSFVNKKYCEFTGLPLSEIISKTDVKVYGKNKTTLRYRKEDKKVITENATLIINEEKYFDKHEKKEKWFQTIKTPIKSIDGKKTQVLGVASDITGLKEAETILKRQLELNEVISNISTEFLNSHFNEIDKVMVNALKTICRNTTMTRATINVTSKDKKIKYLHVWSQHKEDPLLKGFFLLEKYKVEDFKWISNQLKEKGYAFSGDMKKLSKSSLEKKVLSGTEIKSFLIIPLNTRHYPDGYLIVSSFNEVSVPMSDFAFIKTVSQILSTAIERAHTEKTLQLKLELEEIITQISTRFINVETKKITEVINNTLKTTATFLGADQGYLFRFDNKKNVLNLTNSWFQYGELPDMSAFFDINQEDYPWAFEYIKDNTLLSVPEINSLTDTSGKLKEMLISGGVKSILAIPVYFRTKFSGALVFASFEKEYFWSDEYIPLLKILGQVLANALERKRNEEDLHESEKLYRTLAGNIPRSAVLLFNKDLKLTVVEGKIFEDRGYGKNLLEGKSVTEIYDLSEFNKQNDIGEHESLYKKVLQGEKFQIERTYNNKTYQIHIFPIKNEQGEIISGMLMSFDITDLKEIQNKLEKQARELQSSNEDLEQFAYAASHDLQEPLRMVSSYVHLIERKLGENISSEIKEFMYFATDGVKRMQQLINDLLEYSRVERKGKTFSQVDLNKVINAVKFNLHKVISDYHVKIIHPEMPVIKGDYSQITSLFQNLIDNAIKFRNEHAPVVEINYFDNKDYYTFFVKDNGIGIEPKYFERIFVIFQRLNNRNQYPGTGIGLAVCKKIVERHGGKMNVESEPGKGTTFYFDLKK